MEKSPSWSRAHDWKSCNREKRFESSNLSFSATKTRRFSRVFCRQKRDSLAQSLLDCARRLRRRTLRCTLHYASKLARSRCKANALFLQNPRSRRDVCCKATTDLSFSAKKTRRYSRVFCRQKRDSRAIIYRGPRGILCTRGEKEHTSKKVSIVAPDNAISKAKCATCETATPPNSPLHAPLCE